MSGPAKAALIETLSAFVACETPGDMAAWLRHQQRKPTTRPWRLSKRQREAQQIAEIRNHNCRLSGCGSVCTFGDW